MNPESGGAHGIETAGPGSQCCGDAGAVCEPESLGWKTLSWHLVTIALAES